jgi:hypothetical protein
MTEEDFMVFWIIAGAVVLALLVGAWVYDRRRPGTSIRRPAGQEQRDVDETTLGATLNRKMPGGPNGLW